MLLLAQILTWLQMLIFLVFGAWGFVDPVGLAKLSSIELPNSVAQAEFRSFYGGCAMGGAVLLLLTALSGRWRDALWIQIGIYGSVVTGRLIHLATKGSLESLTLRLLFIEATSVALAIFALRSASVR